jgi:membrane protein
MDAHALVSLARRSATKWMDDNAPSRAAALSYYTVFSLSPVLVIAVAVAGFVFGKQAVSGELHRQLDGLVGVQTAQAVQDMMVSASRPRAGLLASAVGVVILLIGATGAFVELQDALNAIWKVEKEKTSGVVAFVRARLLSFAMVGVIAFLLLASLAVSTALSALGHFAEDLLPGGELVDQAINLILSISVITALFASIYKVLPDKKIAWRDVALGSLVTSVLFTIGKLLIALYLGKSSVASSYGAAASFAVLLIWVYYSAMILLFGAAFTQLYAEDRAATPATRSVPSRSAPPRTGPRASRSARARSGS